MDQKTAGNNWGGVDFKLRVESVYDYWNWPEFH